MFMNAYMKIEVYVGLEFNKLHTKVGESALWS